MKIKITICVDVEKLAEVDRTAGADVIALAIYSMMMYRIRQVTVPEYRMPQFITDAYDLANKDVDLTVEAEKIRDAT